jgi:subtilisin family serine protease
MPGVLTVAGLDRRGGASFDASSQGITIGIAAPSEQLVGAVPGGGYSLWSGTSGAAPIVAGVAALVRAAHPELDAAGVINRITSTATPAGAEGVDPIYGFGRLDAAAAVASDVPVVSANPMGDLAEWVRLNRRADSPVAPSQGSIAAPLPNSTPITAPETGVVALLPSAAMLRDVGVPLLLYVAFGVSFFVLVAAATQHFRGLRRRG